MVAMLVYSAAQRRDAERARREELLEEPIWDGTLKYASVRLTPCARVGHAVNGILIVSRAL